MKNKRLELAIIAVTLVFASFTVGFFTGRSSIKGSFTVETQRPDDPEKELEVITDEAVTDTPTNEADTSGLINLNTADLSELSELPGIGEVLAQRIIDYRTENGGFKSIEDIKHVTGIGDTIYYEIRSMITVG